MQEFFVRNPENCLIRGLPEQFLLHSGSHPPRADGVTDQIKEITAPMAPDPHERVTRTCFLLDLVRGMAGG
ncbi:hypothetical protein L3i23_08280 [Herbiconiux sp. L3-i23]|nr:hypothetical protein L3i23_08280 [Herbiconiux sp. L3-i23]